MLWIDYLVGVETECILAISKPNAKLCRLPRTWALQKSLDPVIGIDPCVILKPLDGKSHPSLTALTLAPTVR